LSGGSKKINRKHREGRMPGPVKQRRRREAYTGPDSPAEIPYFKSKEKTVNRKNTTCKKQGQPVE
jgi:hypothetical protein